MPRTHSVWDAGLGDTVQIPFTSDEEAARDIEEAAGQSDMAAARVRTARKEVLRVKLSDDTITEAEIREMLRLERGLG